MNPTNAELPTVPDSQQMGEGNEYPQPRAASSFQRILAQGKYETLAMLKNGEQLMLNIAFPVMALFGLRYTSFLDSYADMLQCREYWLSVLSQLHFPVKGLPLVLTAGTVFFVFCLPLL